MIVNCTPHPIVVRSADGTDTTFAPSGVCPRVSTTPGVVEAIPGFPCPVASPTTFSGVVDMPDPVEGTWFIVSGVVGAAVAGRADVLVPGTGPQDGAVRNEKGHIVAVTRFNRV